MIVDEPWISAILKGEKTWEMRKGVCKIRGPVALIRKGSGHVVGVAEVVDCRPPLTTRAAYAEAEPRHRIPPERQERAFADGWRTPWVFANARSLKNPVPYSHPSGAVIWVILDETVERAVTAQLASASVQQPALSRTPETSSRIQPTRLKGTARVAPSSPGTTREVVVTGGNLRNKHIYLPLDFFPADALGGSNKAQASERPITVTFRPGGTVKSDIDRTKRILRERVAVGEFLMKADFKEGDIVQITCTGPHAFTFSKATNA